MILEYLNVEQTLDYLQRETDYQYTFDNLKELNYSECIDVFFFKVCAIYSTGNGGIAHSIQKVRGIFFVDNILFDNESDSQTFWFREPFVHVEKIIKHLGFFDNKWHDYQKGQSGLISNSDLINIKYNENKEILSCSLEENLINNVERNDLRFKKSQLDKLIKQSKVSIDVVEKSKPTQQYIFELKSELADLENQLAKAKLAYKQADSITHSNTDMHNIKKAAIKQFNRSLATALIELDYQDKLRKSDIVSFIIPYMKKLAFVLADEDEKKADNLTVSHKTLSDTHLQGLNFKAGRQSNDEKNRASIELLFKKQLPVTE